MAESDIKQVDRHTGEVKRSRRFDDRDWKYIAEYVINEYEKRKRKREDRERQWKEIDRQIAMEPELGFKKMPDGRPDSSKAWMAETELHMQAEALEVLTADVRRMMFPDSGSWFSANAEVTDEYLQDIEGKIKVLGVKEFIPSAVNQDNADKIVEAFLLHQFRQYDHADRFDVINSEALKYGVGVGRARLERKNVYINQSRGVVTEEKRTPVIVPCSIKNLYLEEPKPTMHSSTVLGEAHIAVDYMKYENIALAASKGSTNPENEDGGWMPKNFVKVTPDKNGYVRLLEMEGDIIVPRKTVHSIVIPGAIVTVAMGGQDAGGGSTRAVIRFRFRKYPFSSYLLFPYMRESADDAYPTSPLMKGRTMQVAATDAINRFLDSAALKVQPPCGYDSNNMAFTQAGGPEIYPGAQWASIDPIKVYAEIGGDPTAMANAAMQFMSKHGELTGVLPARVGAQTISHTTAYAKQAEVQRGATRTVNYVNKTGQGPMTRWLDMAYQMGRDALNANEDVTIWIAPYGGYVTLDKSCLPEKTSFEWFGAGGPAEKRDKMQNKVAAAKMAVELDQLNMAMQKPSHININGLMDEILREGGWTDLEAITNAQQPQSGGQGAAGGPPAAPGLPGPAQGNPGAAVAALQNLPAGQS